MNLPRDVTALDVHGRVVAESRLDKLVADAIGASISPQTKRSYRRGWAAWAGWAASVGVDPMPPAAADVARFVVAKSEERDDEDQYRYKPSTLALWVTAIGQVAVAAGHQKPGDHEAVRRVLQGLRRQRGSRPRRMRPLGVNDVEQLLSPLPFDSWPEGVKATRDAALLLVGLAGALRRSELSGLDVGSAQWRDDGTVHLLVDRSKTDQEGHGLVKFLPRGDHTHLCPTCALRRWERLVRLADAGRPRSALMAELLGANRSVHVCHADPIPWNDIQLARPLFRPVTRHGAIYSFPDPGMADAEAMARSRYRRPAKDWARLSGQAIHAVVRDRAAEAGLNPTLFGGHSLRAGFITDGFKAGASPEAIRRQTGHKGDAILSIYDRDYNPGSNNAVTGLGF